MQINNWIASTDSPTAQSFSKLNPFTNEVLYTVSQSTVLDVVKALQVAQKSFLAWKDSSIQDRLALLDRILLALPMAFTEKANYEIGRSYLLQMQSELTKPSSSSDTMSPVGVLSALLSWNLSNRIFIDKVISAIMAGNVILVKLSSFAPATALIWKKIFQQAQLPEGVVQFIFSQDRSVQELLLTHPGIKGVVLN